MGVVLIIEVSLEKGLTGRGRKKARAKHSSIKGRRWVILAGAYITQKVALKEDEDEEMVVVITLPSCSNEVLEKDRSGSRRRREQ